MSGLIQVTMQKTKETKGAVLYTELMADGRPVPTVADGKIGQQYIRKAALPEPFPETLTLTVALVADASVVAAAGKSAKLKGA